MEDMLFEKALEKLEDKASLIATDLNRISEKIRRVEKLLKEKNVYKNFSVSVLEEDKLCWFISWELDEVSQRNRLFLITENEEYETTYKKPFIESKIELRIKFVDHLWLFLDKLADSL